MISLVNVVAPAVPFFIVRGSGRECQRGGLVGRHLLPIH